MKSGPVTVGPQLIAEAAGNSDAVILPMEIQQYISQLHIKKQKTQDR